MQRAASQCESRLENVSERPAGFILPISFSSFSSSSLPLWMAPLQNKHLPMDLFEVSLASTLPLKRAAFPSKSLFLMKSGNALPFIHDKFGFSVSVSAISGFCLRATLPSIWWSILGICEDGLKGLALSLSRNLSSGPLLILIGGNRGHASVIGGHSLLPAGWQGAVSRGAN